MKALTSTIVDTPQELTEEWFSTALREGGAIDADVTVTSARTELIGTGQVGMVLRSELAYDDPAGAGPASVVVKLPGEDPTSRQIGVAMGLYESEARFYREIAGLTDIAVPRLYWGDIESDTGRITLVIEDLTGSAEVGDPFAKATPEQAELAFAELVKLHAPLWNDPGLRERRWLADPNRLQMMFDAVAPAVDPFIAAYRDLLEPEHIALVKRLAPKAAAWPARALVDPLVVVHGDFRPDNMMFAKVPGAPPVTVLDWQTCRLGPPLLDHTIFLGGCMTAEDRRECQHELLGRYHQGLVAHGVRGFTFEDCLESYRRSSLFPFLLAVGMSLAISHTERARQLSAQVLRGAAEMVLDLRAADFLE